MQQAIPVVEQAVSVVEQATPVVGRTIPFVEQANLVTKQPHLIAGEPITVIRNTCFCLDSKKGGGEFGRTPTVQAGDGERGRDHHPDGFTVWMAGGGVRGGFRYGATDEYGYHAVEDRMTIHDLHATLLHIMGLDHTQLTFEHAGRDYRLTDVYGEPATKILA